MIIFFWPETSQGSANVTLKGKEYEMKTRRSALINIESGFNNDVSGLALWIKECSDHMTF